MTPHPSDLLGKDLEFSARRLTVVAYDPARGWKLAAQRCLTRDDENASTFERLEAWLPTEMLERLIYEGILVAA